MIDRAALRRKATGEFKELLAVAAYLYVSLGAVILLKSAILQDEGVAFPIWGLAAAKSLILAKFMLVGHALRLGERYQERPLIWPTLYRALIYLLLLLILTAGEELLTGAFTGRSVTSSLEHVVGATPYEGFAVCLVMFLILVPYSAFLCLSEVLGEGVLTRLFFFDRSAALSPPIAADRTRQ